MPAVAWIISIGTFLAGLGAWHDAPRGPAPVLALLLLGVSFLACPYIWDNAAMRALFSGRERAMACVAVLLIGPALLGL